MGREDNRTMEAVLIKNVRPWIGIKQGEFGFYLRQFLSGHGYFQLYLNMMESHYPTLSLFHERHRRRGARYLHVREANEEDLQWRKSV